MPNVRTHDTIALIAAFPLAPLSYSLLTFGGDSPERAAAGAAWVVGAHLVGSYWFSPDLDIDSAIDNRWGPFFWLWRPYMWLVPHRHRILSHSGFSALIRIGYLYLMITLCLMVLNTAADLIGIVPDRPLDVRFREWVRITLEDHRREAFLIGLGAVISDLVHTSADYLVTGGKRYLRIFGIRLSFDYANHDRWYPRRRRRARR